MIVIYFCSTGHCSLSIKNITSVNDASRIINGTTHLKNIKNSLNTNISFYFETSGGQNCNLFECYSFFSTPVLIRHLWQLKTVVFLHRFLILAVLLQRINSRSLTVMIVIDASKAVNNHCNHLYSTGYSGYGRKLQL